jgi:hypothetical protein
MDNLVLLIAFIWCLCMVLVVGDLVVSYKAKRKQHHRFFEYKL